MEFHGREQEQRCGPDLDRQGGLWAGTAEEALERAGPVLQGPSHCAQGFRFSYIEPDVMESGIRVF